MIINSDRVKAYVSDKEYILETDNILVVPSNIPHQLEALETASLKGRSWFQTNKLIHQACIYNIYI